MIQSPTISSNIINSYSINANYYAHLRNYSARLQYEKHKLHQMNRSFHRAVALLALTIILTALSIDGALNYKISDIYSYFSGACTWISCLYLLRSYYLYQRQKQPIVDLLKKPPPSEAPRLDPLLPPLDRPISVQLPPPIVDLVCSYLLTENPEDISHLIKGRCSMGRWSSVLSFRFTIDQELGEIAAVVQLFQSVVPQFVARITQTEYRIRYQQTETYGPRDPDGTHEKRIRYYPFLSDYDATHVYSAYISMAIANQLNLHNQPKYERIIHCYPGLIQWNLGKSHDIPVLMRLSQEVPTHAPSANDRHTLINL